MFTCTERSVRAEENCIMGRSVICTSQQIKEDEVEEAWGICGEKIHPQKIMERKTKGKTLL